MEEVVSKEVTHIYQLVKGHHCQKPLNIGVFKLQFELLYTTQASPCCSVPVW